MAKRAVAGAVRVGLRAESFSSFVVFLHASFRRRVRPFAGRVNGETLRTTADSGGDAGWLLKRKRMVNQTAPKKLLFAELEKLPSADLFKLASAPVRLNEKIAESRDTEREERKFNAKVVSAMKRRYVERLNAREIPMDTPFAKYFEQNAGGQCPGRTQSLAGLFNSLVLTNDADGKPLLTERIYDGAALDWLEKANAIVNAAMKAHGENWKSSPEVLAALAALTTPGDAAKTLDDLRKQQKGESEAAQTGDAAPLTVGRAVEFLLAFIKTAGDRPEPEAAAAYHGCINIADAWSESGVGEDLLEKWTVNIQAGRAPEITVITRAPATAATAPAEIEEAVMA